MFNFQAARWRAHPSAPALALALASFLTQFDLTAVVIAMPSIGRDLGFGIAGFAWVMDAYSLAFTGLLLAAGALADRHGRRRALLGGNVLFAIASLACGLAWNGPSLWIARGLQGVAAAFMVTGVIALIAGAYPKPAERARAFAVMGIISGAAMALGPTLGGAAAAWLGWRWIFWANLPVCALVAWAVPRVVIETRDVEGRPLDLPGIALLTFALGIAIETLLGAGHAPVGAAVGLSASSGLAVAFVLQQRRRPRPLLDPDLLAQPAMIGVAVLLFAVSVGYWAVLVYLPLFLQAAFELSPEQIGVVLLAATLPMVALPSVGGRVQLRWGWRLLFASGLGLVAVGDLVLAAALGVPDTATRIAVVLLGMACIGTGAGLVQAQLSGAVVALAPPAQAGMASAITIVLRQGGFAIGIAALGAMLETDATVDGYLGAFLLAAAVSAAGTLAAFRLLPKPISVSPA